jgi:hypothetical protein
MNGDRLSATTRSLLKSARADAPSTAARAKVWSGVSAAAGGVAGAGAGASGLGAPGAASTGAAKLLAAGTLLGGVITVGLAALLLHVGPSPSHAPPASTAAVLAASLAASEPPSRLFEAPAPAPALDTAAPGLNPLPVVDAPGHAGNTDSTSSPVARGASGTSGARHGAALKGKRSGAGAAAPPPSRPPAGDDALTREASLVSGARTALASGNAEEALRLVRAARAMPSPQLVPEELTVEAQALRSLGKADEARGVDATLHAQFPDSALAR